MPCEKCRQWSNDNFEHRVRHLVEPIIFGEQAEVSREYVTAVATWIGYQSMICSISSADAYFGRFPDRDFRFENRVDYPTTMLSGLHAAGASRRSNTIHPRPSHGTTRRTL